MIAALRRRLAESARRRHMEALCLCGHTRYEHDYNEGPCIEGWVCSLTDGQYVWHPVARFCLCRGFADARTNVGLDRQRLHCGPRCECHRAQSRLAREKS
ncbi:hypothetical protein [Cellulosimicrobium sp. Marseille-Q4280]|uniref:hypothetical protein n=1 Tax=Cellulosimicrobium sp. Marseille-Q4280 TaxID=2937992 RepID=UPI00203C6C3E|nr:hypothetical protein [Cellulosimicrobium sp. Marseille-Q4280]